MRRSRSWREPGASTGYVPAVNDSDHWENTRRTVRGEAVQPPVVRAQTTRHSLAARDLDAGGPSAARGRQPTTFLQQDEAGQERQARVVRRGRFRKFRLLILFMSLLGIGFLFATPRGGVSGFGRRSNQYVQHIVEKGKSWTATQLEFVQRWQYGMQLFDLYSAVRRGQWPASSVGAPRRASGRRVFLRDVQSGHYVRVVTHEEEPEKRAHSRNLGKLGSVQPGELIADQPVPWLHGGAFELYDARKTLLHHSVREGGAEPETKEKHGGLQLSQSRRSFSHRQVFSAIGAPLLELAVAVRLEARQEGAAAGRRRHAVGVAQPGESRRRLRRRFLALDLPRLPLLVERDLERFCARRLRRRAVCAHLPV